MGWFKRKIVQWTLKNLFCAVTDDDILKIGQGKIMLLGDELTRQQAQDLSRFAESLQNSKLWKAITAKIRQQANKRMYEKSQNMNDLVFGKAMLYNLDVLEQFVERLANLR